MRRLVPVLLGVCLAGTGQAAPISRDGFAWRSALQGDITNGGLYRVRVPAALLDGSRAFPADLRILDRDGDEWPFFIWRPTAPVADPGFRVERLQSAIEDLPERHLREDLRVQSLRPTGSAVHSRLVAVTAGEDFTRRVEVMGSADGKIWQPLGEGYLIDEPRDARLGNRVISYTATNLPYLRLLIHPSPRNTREDLSLQRIDVLPEAKEQAFIETRRLTEMPTPREDLKVGVQTLEYDLGYRNLPVMRMHIETAGTNFACPVKVFGRNAATNSWRWVADGGVHRMGGQTRDVVDLDHTSYRYFKVELYMYEAPPIPVTNVVVKVEPAFLVVEAQNGGRAHAYFGASLLSLPRYDLLRRTSEAEILSAAPVELAGRERNPARLAVTLLKYARTLATLAVGALSILGAVVLVNWLRRRVTG